MISLCSGNIGMSPGDLLRPGSLRTTSRGGSWSSSKSSAQAMHASPHRKANMPVNVNSTQRRQLPRSIMNWSHESQSAWLNARARPSFIFFAPSDSATKANKHASTTRRLIPGMSWKSVGRRATGSKQCGLISWLAASTNGNAKSLAYEGQNTHDGQKQACHLVAS